MGVMRKSYNTYNTYNHLQKSLLCVLLYGSLKAGNGFGHRHVRLTAGGIVVAATLEVTRRKGIHIHSTARAQRHADEILVLGEHRRHTHLLDSEGVVNKTLAVALLEPEAAHLIFRE